MICYAKYRNVQVKIIAHLTIFGAFFIFLFSLYMFYAGNYTGAIIELSVAAVGIISLKIFAKAKKVNYIANVDIMLLFILLLYLFISGGYKNTGILWMYCLPVAVLFSKGNKKGLRCLIGYFSIILTLIGLHFFNVYKLKFDDSLIIMFVLSFIVFSFFIYSFEKMKENSEKMLFEKMGEIKKLNRELKHLSSYDNLTQVYNRRMILLEIEKEIDRESRYKHGFCVALLDIDHFKQVNDNYGHLLGDKVLKVLCENINKNVLRKTDVLGRYGGEEFLILIPETDVHGAEILSNRIKDEISSIEFNNDSGKKVKITASIGIAQYEHNEEIDSLLARADNALYKAKNYGRNRIEIL